MSQLGSATTVTLMGLDGARVLVEVNITSGLPKVHIVGMPDASIMQAQHRTFAAIANSGFEAPHNKVVINLTPASLPKAGTHFDLAIAVAMLRAMGVVPSYDIGVVVLGELSLDGRLRPVPGILPMVRSARRFGASRVLVPSANADEASLVEGIRVTAVASLAAAAEALGADVETPPVTPIAVDRTHAVARETLDIADVIGNEEAVEAITIAAAGAHHLLMVGPPGAGKTMLAARLPGILPEMSVDEALESASMRSLVGHGVPSELDRTPPFQAPHHSTTMAALIGGGSGGALRPGAAPLASGGVLFLDEAPEFSRTVLDALRQPLEDGAVTIHRAKATAQFPARFQLVLAANPCPCGKLGTGDCTCTPQHRRTYFSKLSGPLVDRIDLQLRVERVQSAGERASGTSSAVLRERVQDARGRAAHRLGATPWSVMGSVPGPWLRRNAPLRGDVTAPIDAALQRGLLTMRGYDRVVRLAWTIADLAGAAEPCREHIGRALMYRKGVQ